MRYAHHILRCHRPYVDLQVEAADEFGEIPGPAPCLFTLLLLQVELASLQIFLCHGPVVERPHLPQHFRDCRGLGGQLKHQRARAIGPCLSALQRVVVYQDKTVHAQLEFTRQVLQVF